MGNIHTVGDVTSDYQHQTIVTGSGGMWIIPKKLQQEMETCAQNREPPTAGTRKTNDTASGIGSEMLEKLEKMR